MRRALLLALVVARVARGETPADVPTFRVEPVVSCNLKSGEAVGTGCWLPAADCIAKAREQRAIRETLAEAEKVPADAPGQGLGWKGAAVLVVLGLGAGFAVGKAAK